MSCLEKNTDCQSQSGMSLSDTECEVKPKRQQQALTLCQVCNIQLNSSAQAQIHYNGKTHQRRLRQANRAKTSMGPEGKASLASLPVQPQTDQNYVPPVRVNSSSPLSLFTNFIVMDPVQKAVISHAFSIVHSPKKKQIITCNICHLRFNSTSQAEAHYKGHKHARKLKAADKFQKKKRILGKSVWMENAISNTLICSSQASDREKTSVQSLSVTLQPVSHTPALKSLCERKSVPESTGPAPPDDPECLWKSGCKVKGKRNRRKSSRSLQCAVCKVTVNSGSQLEDHYKGSKHRLMLGGCRMSQWKLRGKADLSCAAPRRTKSYVNYASADQSRHCNLCDIDVNSKAQLQQHISSRRHRDRATGQAPEFNSYVNNTAHSLFTTKLTLQKELSRTLTSSLLSSSLSPAALCNIATGPVSLSHLHPQASIVQAPLFSHTLFPQPSPSPLRVADAPIIFCPY